MRFFFYCSLQQQNTMKPSVDNPLFQKKLHPWGHKNMLLEYTDNLKLKSGTRHQILINWPGLRGKF
jgi:hypothetical protein